MSPKQLHEEVFHVNKNKFMLQKKKKKFLLKNVINFFQECSPYNQKQFKRNIEQIYWLKIKIKRRNH